MDIGSQDNTQYNDDDSSPFAGEQVYVMEGFENLYIGRIKAFPGSISTDGQAKDAEFWGEVLFNGQLEEGYFRLERLVRFALYGSLRRPEEDERIGIFSMVGPLTESHPMVDDQSSGAFQELPVDLHYEYLPEETGSETGDYVFPWSETVAGRLTWNQPKRLEEENYDETTTPVEIAIKFEFETDSSEVMEALVLDEKVVPFFRAGTGTDRDIPKNSIPAFCDPPNNPCAEENTHQRRLPIKCISISKDFDAATIESILKTQIKGVCNMWRNKAALNLTIDTTLHKVTNQQDLDQFSKTNGAEELSITGTGFRSLTQVEVYLVDTLEDRSGGGITHYRGKAAAFTILALDKAQQPAYNLLLAHEIGHALGLYHPNDNVPNWQKGDAGSIMEDSQAGNHPQVNTVHNANILALKPGTLYNSIVETTTIPDCIDPNRT